LDLAIIGEPTQMRMAIAEKGLMVMPKENLDTLHEKKELMLCILQWKIFNG
jgi:hypothetical protein